MEKEPRIIPFERGYEIKFKKLSEEIDTALETIEEFKSSKQQMVENVPSEDFDRAEAEKISLSFVDTKEKLDRLVEELAGLADAWDNYRKQASL